ncbi:MAG TPA: hypothetical protein VFM18_19375 [Methanosarcina sp.]|nr:hypothetical protein [Methanosarcina sp.]
MNSVKVNKKELLEILRANKEKHVTEFNEAVSDYKAGVAKLAKANLKLANSGDLDKFKQIRGVPNAPTSYETSYSRAIRMLELSVEEVIEVGEHEFNQLVLDEWDWKHNFTTSNAFYKSI